MESNVQIVPGTDSLYCQFFNLSSLPINLRIDGQSLTIESGGEEVFPGSRQKIQLANANNDLRCAQYLTGEVSSVFVYSDSDEPDGHPWFRSKMRDFHWLSGLSPQRLRDSGEAEIDEDIEGVFSSNQALKPFFLPTLRNQIDLLHQHWVGARERLEKAEVSGTIPHIFHFVWISAEFGKPVAKLRKSHLARAKSWLRENEDAFEYWIWTDAESEDALNIEELREYARELGISERLRVIPMDQLRIDAKRHFRPDRFLKLSDRTGSEVGVTYQDILNVILEFAESPNVGIRSDVLKFTILYLYGGVYLDINDTECIKPFASLIQPFDFVACMEPQGYINTAMAGARRHSEVLLSYLLMLWWQRKQIAGLNNQIDNYRQRLASEACDENEALRIRNAIDKLVVRRTGPIAFTKAILGYLSEDAGAEKVAVLPSAYLYPGWGLMRSHTRDEWLKPVSYANHYDERAYVGHTNISVDDDIRRALGQLPGSSSVRSSGYL